MSEIEVLQETDLPVAEDEVAPVAAEEAARALADTAAPALEDEAGPAPEDAEPVDGQTESEADDLADPPVEPVYSDRELNAAKRFGFDPEALDALGDQGKALAERLAKIQTDIGRRYSRIGQTERLLRDQQIDPDPSDDESVEESEHPDAASPAATGRPEQGGPLGALGQEVASLREQIDSLAADRWRRQWHEAQAQTDRFFAGLDSDVYPQFGLVPWAQLPDDSGEFQRRAELVTKAGEILRGHELVHGRPMDVADALEQALAIVAPEAKVAADRRKLSDDLRRRARQRIARPTQRRTTREYESPQQRTAEALDHWEKARGVRFFRD